MQAGPQSRRVGPTSVTREPLSGPWALGQWQHLHAALTPLEFDTQGGLQSSIHFCMARVVRKRKALTHRSKHVQGSSSSPSALSGSAMPVRQRSRPQTLVCSLGGTELDSSLIERMVDSKACIGINGHCYSRLYDFSLWSCLNTVIHKEHCCNHVAIIEW